MNRQADYIYTRKNGGKTECFGELEEDSRFDLSCEDEINDIIWGRIIPEDELITWREVCIYLENSYCSTIKEIIAC